MASRRKSRRQGDSESEREWQCFPDLPGAHLVWRMAGKNLYNIDSDTTTLATVRFKMSGVSAVSVTADGHYADFESRPSGLSLPGPFGIFGNRTLIKCSTGEVVAEKNGHHKNRRANGTLTLVGLGEFHFPVVGSGRDHAVMSAVGESGSTLVKYRYEDPELKRTSWGASPLEGVQVAVAPYPYVEIESTLLLVALSTEWLRSYFISTGGG